MRVESPPIEIAAALTTNVDSPHNSATIADLQPVDTHVDSTLVDHWLDENETIDAVAKVIHVNEHSLHNLNLQIDTQKVDTFIQSLRCHILRLQMCRVRRL